MSAATIGLLLLIVLVAIIVKWYRTRHHPKPMKRFSYSKVALEDDRGTEMEDASKALKTDFEVLFEDLASTEPVTPAPQKTTAVLRSMVTSEVDMTNSSILDTIELVKNFTASHNMSAREQDNKREAPDWIVDTYSPKVSNPLLATKDGLGLIIARKYAPKSFWEKIFDENISCIVDIENDGDVSIWPSGESFRIGGFDVVSSLEIQNSTRVVRNFYVRRIGDGKSISVTVFSYRRVSCHNDDIPISKEDFTNFIGLVVDARQNQDDAGSILLFESPVMCVFIFTIFSFDCIIATQKLDLDVLLNHIPLSIDDDTETVVPMTQAQLEFCCFVILEDIERSFSR